MTTNFTLPAFTLSRWFVTVDGYDRPRVIYAPSAGRALANAWRSFPIPMSYKDFLRIASCKKDRNPPSRFGNLIQTDIGPVYFISMNEQYVQICIPGKDHVSNIHPLEVHDCSYRPRYYRYTPSDLSLYNDSDPAPAEQPAKTSFFKRFLNWMLD